MKATIGRFIHIENLITRMFGTNSITSVIKYPSNILKIIMGDVVRN